jgi:hypothetical protein
MGCKLRSKPNNAKPAMFRISLRVVDLVTGSNGKGKGKRLKEKSWKVWGLDV